jgi:hypothetical protein
MDTPFFGGFYVGRSREIADNRCINLFPEFVDTKDGKAVGALYGCPGLDLLGSAGTGPQRGSYFASNGVLYVVSGNQLFSVSSTWVATPLGIIGTTTGPVQMVDNGKQLLLVDGQKAWCLVFVTGAFINVLPALIGVVPMVLAYQDGFGLVNFVGTNQWYQSNLNDFTTWSALNFSSADSTPFGIVTMYDLHREVWLFKSDRIEVWINAGLPNFAFQRLQGVQIPNGCIAPSSVSRIGDSIVWLGGDEQGQGIVYMSAGYQAARISTHAIEYVISQYSTISDAIAYTYQDTGHIFYVLTFPSGNQTFVYDYTTKLWHERAAFSNGAFSRHIGNSHAFAYGKQVIGDFQNGNLYAFDNNTYTDNGNVRKWLRSWRAFPPNTRSYVPFRFDSLFIDCMTGFNIPPGLDPQFMLRWSDDGGYTWSNEWWTDGNKIGATTSRIIYQRLGSTKRSAGLDRIFELSGTDPVPQAIVAVDLDGGPT